MRLLVLDGEPGWDQGLTALLVAKGLALQRCSRGDQAQNLLLAAEAVDLVVVDLDGCRCISPPFVQWLRQQTTRPPVLVVGSSLSERRRVSLLESWADDVVPMPLPVSEFAARCRALGRRHRYRLAQQRQQVPQTVLRHGAVAMWVEEHRVCSDGVPVELSPREFRLLEHLLRHPGQIFDRASLLEQVWGEFSSLDLDPKTVDVHIRWLRTKLESDPAAPRLIVTVRGRGYRLA